MSARNALAVALSAVAACSLTTDLDGFTTGGGADAGAAEAGVASEAGTGADATAAPLCPADTDFDDDPKNCGTCGHDCLGGECERGRCEPFVIAQDIQFPTDVAPTSAGLYISSDEGLILLESNGRKKHITRENSAPQFMVATATDVFFADFDAASLRRVAIGSTEVVTLKTSIENIFGLALSPEFIFFSREEQNIVQRMTFSTSPQPDATLEDVATGYPAADLDWSNGSLYIASYEADEVVEVPQNGDVFMARRTIHEGCGPVGVKIEGNDAYITCDRSRELLRVSIDGSKPPAVLAERLDGPVGVALTPTSIYLAVGDDGTVLQLAR